MLRAEFYGEETGEVYNNVGKHTEFKRLYNAPWMSVLVLEMYNLTGDKAYLEKMFKLLSVYYSIGRRKVPIPTVFRCMRA